MRYTKYRQHKIPHRNKGEITAMSTRNGTSIVVALFVKTCSFSSKEKKPFCSIAPNAMAWPFILWLCVCGISHDMNCLITMNVVALLRMRWLRCRSFLRPESPEQRFDRLYQRQREHIITFRLAPSKGVCKLTKIKDLSHTNRPIDRSSYIYIYASLMTPQRIRRVFSR